MLEAAVLIGLAAWRLWRLAATDELTEPLRARLPTGLASFVACPWCLGFWCAVAVTVAVDLTVGVPAPVLVGAAAAALVPLIEGRA
jgi:hypothetical protein